MGAYLGIVSGAIKFLNFVAGRLQQHHDEINGTNAQKVSDLTANAEQATNAAIIEDHNAALDRDALADKLSKQTGVRP